jgi:hypothetical protein
VHRWLTGPKHQLLKWLAIAVGLAVAAGVFIGLVLLIDALL